MGKCNSRLIGSNKKVRKKRRTHVKNQDCRHTKNTNKNRINKKRSSSIRFTFGATGGLPPFVFECTLDGMPVGCGTFTNLAAGQHTFSVAALDNLVNQDPQPPVFRWTINAVIPTNTANTLHTS